MRTALLVVVAIAGLMSMLCTGGCATSRLDQLHNKANKVENALKAEQRKALELSSDNPVRQQKITHLSTLRGTLSAANVGLGAVRYMPEEDRDTAYDVLDEVYGTIDWNIPLGPGEPQKALPSKFTGGVLKLR